MVESASAEAVDDEEHLVVVLPENRVPPAAQRQRAAVVAAHVDDREQVGLVGDGVNVLGQGGKVDVGAGEVGADQSDSRLFQFCLRVLGAEVGVHNVDVGNGHLFPRGFHPKGQIDGDVGLAASVMAGQKHDAFEIQTRSSFLVKWLKKALVSKENSLRRAPVSAGLPAVPLKLQRFRYHSWTPASPMR